MATSSDPDAAYLEAGQLSATVKSSNRHGWCGLEDLTHADHPIEWQLSPALTLEHYVGVPTDAPEYVEYEPTRSPRQLLIHSTTSCELVYGRLPCAQMEVRVRYTLAEPHYVDVDLEAVTQRSDWPYGSVALFFATIVQAPLYQGVHLLGDDVRREGKRRTRWLHFNGLASAPGRTAHPAGVEHPELGRPDPTPNAYFYDDSSVRFEQPFYYATLGPMAYALLFREQYREQVRFTVNPVAPAFGGPAWDFFWIIGDPSPGATSELSLRLVWKPFAGSQDILDEFERYSAN